MHHIEMHRELFCIQIIDKLIAIASKSWGQWNFTPLDLSAEAVLGRIHHQPTDLGADGN